MNSNMNFKIGNFDFEQTPDTFIIAEMSANHNGSIECAIETIRAAKRAGANAIKLQTYTADTITLDVKSKDFEITQGTIWDGKYLYDLYKEAFTPWEWHAQLFEVAKAEGLVCFSSPFDFSSVDFLESLGTPAYKIASPEITDIPLIKYVASKGKPVIISTGIATMADIELALNVCRQVGNYQIALLKCTTSYPAPIEEANLTMIKDFRGRFGVVSGLSDHTMGIVAPIVATTLGARIIEKHFIIDRSIGGPDASFSLNEGEFTAMCKAVRAAEQAVGIVDYTLSEKQISSKDFSRSLYAVADIQVGDIITEANVRSVRPGYGLHPKYLDEIIGKKSIQNIKRGTAFQLSFITEQ